MRRRLGGGARAAAGAPGAARARAARRARPARRARTPPGHHQERGLLLIFYSYSYSLSFLTSLSY